ncbi:MAG: serine/threonine protein kinase [Acidobacteriota bacterium]|nr:serine/threonine protein kinase [Acidobacteriota bacterium]
MTPQRWAQIRQVFDGALERPAKDRAAYLRVLCARDEELRHEVESLLRSHEQSEEFLETPAAQLSQIVSQEDIGDYPHGYRVGPYEFDRRIGRGGMGAVWLANRFDKEYKRQVAIKMVKRGMNSQEILRRFRTERQVLASLNHPNIARLIDGGSTPDGLPYLVMEYVEGTPIDQYCDHWKCTISERLQLFRDVCSAVHYAHQNLVVHRDIKTSNILVTPGGIPKLLDFGIAKLLGPEGSTLDLAQTRPEMRPMTLDYASPEQVRGESITTATDVYSLGVLLYRLLTGKMPYGPNLHSQAAMQNAICEKEPIRPSAQILSDDSTAVPEATQKLEAFSETRVKARKRLRRKLSGDLDNIILMALRKEPHRRYLSVGQFSEDIRRYLEGHPVVARLDTPGYRIAKFVRRHPESIGAAVLASASLLTVAAFSERSARLAVSARQTAERNLQQTRHELIAAYTRAQEPQAAYATAQFEFHANPAAQESRMDLAETSRALGDAAETRGNHREAVQFYRDALAQCEALALMNSKDAGAQRDVMVSANALGAAQLNLGDLAGATFSYTRALQVTEGLAALEGSQLTPATLDEVAAANRRVGELLSRSGAKDAGAEKLRKALKLYRQLSSSETNPAVAELTRQLAH